LEEVIQIMENFGIFENGANQIQNPSHPGIPGVNPSSAYGGEVIPE
jgi:hypothetical protein